MECRRVKYGLGTVDIFDKTFNPAGKGKILFSRVALIDQLDLDSIIKERKFTQPFGDDLVMEFNRAENFIVRQKVDFGTPVFPLSR